MRLRGRDKSELQLVILGYEFPEIENDVWDSNWLMVRVVANTIDGNWEFTDPCLQTNEAQRLCDWLAEIAEQKIVQDKLRFMEPYLSFEKVKVTGEGLSLRVLHKHPEHDVNGVLQVTLDMTRGDLKLAVEEFRIDLRQFPSRAVAGN